MRALWVWVLLLVVAGSGVGCATARRLFEPRTPRRWIEVRGPHVTLFTDGDLDAAPGVLQEIEARLSAVCFAFQIELSAFERVNVVLFHRRWEYEELAPRGTSGFYHRGSALPTVVMFGVWDDDRRATVTHELTHHAVARIYGSPPVWLNEGLATFFETLFVEDGMMTVGAAREGVTDKTGVPTLSALVDMRSDAFYVEDVDLNAFDYASAQAYNYRMAWMVVHYLMTTEGPMRAPFDDYLAARAAGKAAPSLFRGVDLAALERTILEQYSFRAIPMLRTPYTSPPAVAFTTHPVTRSRVPL